MDIFEFFENVHHLVQVFDKQIHQSGFKHATAVFPEEVAGLFNGPGLLIWAL